METARWVERICDAGTSVNWPAWSAIGTILAAVATFTAVWTALRASEREHRRTIELRDAEWDRQDKATRVRAGVLAQTFRRELLLATFPLRGIRDLLVEVMETPSNTASKTAAMALVGPPWAEPYLPMLQRMAGNFEGFQDSQAVKLMNAISAWSMATRPVPLELAQGPIDLVEEFVAQRLVDIETTLEIFDELRGLLEQTAYEVGFIDERPLDEVALDVVIKRREATRRFKEARKKRALDLQHAFATACAPSQPQSEDGADGA